jgi:hypothetical protein
MTPLPGPLTGAPAGVGYLLKDRVADVSDFVEAISRVLSRLSAASNSMSWPIRR